MIPASSYDQIDKILNDKKFEHDDGSALDLPQKTRTVGFILFDQDFGRDPIRDVVANLDMLNLHSGTHMHFFLCGVSKFGANESGARELGTLGRDTFYHNANAAHSFIEAFGREIPGWNYDFGFELVLVDVTDNENGRQLDFTSAIFFKVDKLIKIGIIEKPSELFSKLVKIAREGKFTTAAEIRSKLRTIFGTKWLMGPIFAMFPQSVHKLLVQAHVVLGGGASTPDK